MDDDAAGAIFRDVVLLALAGFVAIVLLLLPHVNPPGAAAEADAEPPGAVIVELFWDNGRDVDLDLWVAAPNDRVVGYSNRGAVYFNLLRDGPRDLQGRDPGGTTRSRSAAASRPASISSTSTSTASTRRNSARSAPRRW